jgi:membrane-associated phospholipid phosphatase
MFHSLLHQASRLGDDAITGSLALALIVYLLLIRQKKAALTIAAAYIVTAAILALGKLALYSRCAPTDIFFGLRSPSGHSALSLISFGLFAAFVSTSLCGWRRFAPYLMVAPLIAAISVSRVALNAHTESDVIIGLFMGLVSSMVFWRLFMRDEIVRMTWKAFTLIPLVLALLLSGVHFSAEGFISNLALSIRRHFLSC